MLNRIASRLPPPSFGFLLAKPAHFIALGFGAGLAPVVPGTFGSLVAFPIAWALHASGSTPLYVAVTAALFLMGIWAAGIAGRDLGVADHGSIVIDEVVGMLMVLFVAQQMIAMQLAAFVLFRVFDIVKPPPVRQADARLKNGFGVMFDDVLAALYAIAVLLLVQHYVVA
jgi:phosphatidylglycerophosphatase A